MPTLTQVTLSRAKLSEPVEHRLRAGAGPTSVALNPLTSTPALPAMGSN